MSQWYEYIFQTVELIVSLPTDQTSLSPFSNSVLNETMCNPVNKSPGWIFYFLFFLAIFWCDQAFITCLCMIQFLIVTFTVRFLSMDGFYIIYSEITIIIMFHFCYSSDLLYSQDYCFVVITLSPDTKLC